jgi:hypothetical protein
MHDEHMCTSICAALKTHHFRISLENTSPPPSACNQRPPYIDNADSDCITLRKHFIIPPACSLGTLLARSLAATRSPRANASNASLMSLVTSSRCWEGPPSPPAPLSPRGSSCRSSTVEISPPCAACGRTTKLTCSMEHSWAASWNVCDSTALAHPSERHCCISALAWLTTGPTAQNRRIRSDPKLPQIALPVAQPMRSDQGARAAAAMERALL